MQKVIDYTLKGTDLDGLDLKTYRGKCKTLFSNGKCIKQEDNRDLRFEKLRKIKELNDHTQEMILKHAPLHKQINQIAGRLPKSEADELEQKIQRIRDHCRRLKHAVLAAEEIKTIQVIFMNDPIE